MAFKYNPLLKIGLENTGNGGGGGDNSQKVTKFFYATDTLEDGEIAQYQGVNDVDNNLINGFFYKVDVTPITIIPAGTPYLYFTKPFESDVFNIIANDRYYLIESNVFTLNNNFAWSPDNPAFFYPYQYIEPATIGNPVYCQALKQYKLITAINGDTIVCDDISFIYGGHLAGPFTFSKYINQDGQVIFVSPGASAVIYQHNNLQYGFAPIVLSPTPSIQQGTTNQQITLGGNNFTRVDTQPNSSYTLPIATPDVLGGVKVGSGLDIDESGILSVAAGDNLKVPRCFTQAQINTLSANDIFQWQGDTTAELVKGYFYKKNYPLPPNTWYFEITDDLLVNNTTIIKKGIYQFVSGETLSLATDYLIKYHNGDQPMLYYIANPIVGVSAITRHFETDVINNVIITDISEDNITINTGIVFNGVARNYSAGTFNKFVNANGDVIFVPFYATEGQVIAGTSVVDIVVSVINNTYNVYAPYPAPITILKSGSSGFELIQVDTQPQPTNGSDLIVDFTPDTSAVRANIQSGETLATIAGKLSNIFKSLNTFVFTIDDYSYGICLIDVTDWYIDNTSTNYRYVLNGLICTTRYFGFVDSCSVFNVCANCNYTRNYILMYSKNNGYSVNVVNYNSRYYIAINRNTITSVQLTFFGVCSNLLTTPIQLTANDVPVIYSGVEY